MGEPEFAARVLVIDDEQSIRLMIREILTASGLIVEEADGGDRGLERFDEVNPDIVLLDVLMPDLDGFSVLGALRKHPKGARCPVVMVTGIDDAEAVDRAYELGATDFITKPIHWRLFRQRVRYLLRAHGTAAHSRHS